MNLKLVLNSIYNAEILVERIQQIQPIISLTKKKNTLYVLPSQQCINKSHRTVLENLKLKERFQNLVQI